MSGALAATIIFSVIAVLAFTFQVIRMALAHEEKKLALRAGRAGSEDKARLEQIVAANEAELSKLRQRVEVLERLATDDEHRLSREIAGLKSDRTTA